jgi:chaperonin GroEL
MADMQLAAQCVDLVEAGLMDPTNVVRTALENALSMASLLQLTAATLTELPEPKATPVPDAEEEV